MQIKRLLLAALAVGAIGLVACSDDKDEQAGSATGPTAQIAQLAGVSTSVDLDPATAAVLQQNGVSVAPVAPATAAMQGGMTVVSFPITGGNVAIYPQDQLPFIRGKVTHSGGLTFSAGGKSLTATDFVVDPGTSILTATVGGQSVPLLDLDGSKVQVGKDAQGRVLLDGTVAKLSTVGADALNKTFGVSVFAQGIPIGVVHIVATGAAGS